MKTTNLVGESQHRRLLTILFADVQNYSKLLHSDEAEALSLIGKFNEVIKEESAKHSGEIQHFRGDGCMITFDSVLNATHFALDAQLRFWNGQRVPVRMGIHKGEVVSDGNTVYGDSVNIAARIEGVAQTHGVYISKSVRNQLTNQPIYIVDVGKVKLKNIEEPYQLYALKAPFLAALPKRRDFPSFIENLNQKALQISAAAFILLVSIFLVGKLFDGPSQGSSKGLIAISTFENKTNNPELNTFGEFTSDFISRSLIRIHQSILPTSRGQHMVHRQSFFSLPKDQIYQEADYLIEGKFYLEDDQLSLHAQLVDVKTDQLAHTFPTVKGKLNDKSELVNELTEYILGYWSINKIFTLKRKPPKYQAHKLYMKALEAHDQRDTQQVEANFLEAFKIDTTFYDALISLGYHYYNYKLFDHLENIVTLLDTKEVYFDDYEQLQSDALQALYNGDIRKEAFIYQEMAKIQPFSTYYRSGHALLRINQPVKALEYADSALQLVKFIGSPDHQRVLSLKLNCLNELGNYKQAQSLLDSADFIITENFIPYLYTRSCGGNGEIIDGNVIREKFSSCQHVRDYPLMIEFNICYSLFIENHETYKTYCREVLNMFDNENVKSYTMAEARIRMMFGEYKQALSLFQSQNGYKPHAELMYCALKSGKNAAANDYKADILQIIEQNRSNASLSALKTYELAMYYAAIEDFEQALYYLEQAHHLGMGFTWIRYRHDMMLKDMKGYEPFRKFVEHKG